MFKTSLFATIVGIGLVMAGPTQVALAGGLFHHHHNKSQQSFSFAAPAMTTQAFTFAAPQAFTFAAPMTTQAFTFAAPAVSQSAMQYAIVPMAAPGQTQAQAQDAIAQFGISDITTIIDLLGWLPAFRRGGNGGNLNPGGGGIDLGGNRPIEVKVTICTDGSNPPPSGGGASDMIENDPLLKLLKDRGVQFAAPMALPAAAKSPGEAQGIESKLEAIVKRLDALEKK